MKDLRCLLGSHAFNTHLISTHYHAYKFCKRCGYLRCEWDGGLRSRDAGVDETIEFCRELLDMISRDHERRVAWMRELARLEKDGDVIGYMKTKENKPKLLGGWWEGGIRELLSDLVSYKNRPSV